MGPAAELRGDDPSRGDPSAPGAAPGAASEAAPEVRDAPRITLMLRAGKLVFGEAEYLCVLRDVSETGIKIRLFHPLPAARDTAQLELGGGARYPIEKMWENAEEAGFRFVDGPVSLTGLAEETGPFPRRHLRLKLDVPGVVSTLSGARMCFVQDISQLGALIVCDPPLPLGARVTVSGPGLPELAGIVRWRKQDAHGLVFARGFRLDELARLADSLHRGSEPSAPAQQFGAGR